MREFHVELGINRSNRLVLLNFTAVKRKSAIDKKIDMQNEKVYATVMCKVAASRE